LPDHNFPVVVGYVLLPKRRPLNGGDGLAGWASDAMFALCGELSSTLFSTPLRSVTLLLCLILKDFSMSRYRAHYALPDVVLVLKQHTCGCFPLVVPKQGCEGFSHRARK